MKTVYHTTRSFIRHQGNVVDLEEYRRRLAQVNGSLALAQPEELPRPRPERPRRARVHVKARRRSLADWLDLTAGAITAAVAMSAWLYLML